MTKEIDEKQKAAEKLVVDEQSSVDAFPRELAERFEPLQLVGSGNAALVYKARNRVSEQLVAIKLLKTVDELQLRRFKNEAQLIAKLAHPNIVAQYDFGIADGAPYLIMEYVEGPTLADELKRERLQPARFVSIFSQICDALEHANRSGVVHRDIKPSNILLTTKNGTEVAKLSDFGIAKATVEGEAQNLTQTGEVVGTPLYMSPEQSMGHKLTHASDLYSLGCIMYEALTGQPPIAGSNLLDTVYKRLNEEPKRFSQIGVVAPAVLEEIIFRCLQRDPDHRYKSANDLKAALNGASVPMPVSASPKPNLLPIIMGIFAVTALVVAFAVTNPKLHHPDTVGTALPRRPPSATTVQSQAEPLPAGAEHLLYMREFEFQGDSMSSRPRDPVVSDGKADSEFEQKLRSSQRAHIGAMRWDQWYQSFMEKVGLKPGLEIPKNMFSSMQVNITSSGDVFITPRNEPAEGSPEYALYKSVHDKVTSLAHTDAVRFPESGVQQIEFDINLGGSPVPYSLQVRSNPLLKSSPE